MQLGFTGKTVYVLGLGKSGRSVVRALREDGATVWVWDEKADAVGDFTHGDVTVMPPETMDKTAWGQVAAVIKSPGLDMRMPVLAAAMNHHVPILGDIDLLYRRAPHASYIGITGTNGKSTTTALIAHVLHKAKYTVAMGGNIGVPVMDLPILGKGGMYVLELSSYQLETLQELQLDSAILINLTPDHLERHGTMSGYLDAKMNIFKRCKPTATKVMGIDHVLTRAAATSVGAQTVLMMATAEATNIPAHYRIGRDGKLRHQGEQVANLKAVANLPGPHNWQNLTCAMLAVEPWLDHADFLKHATTFVPLPHRMEPVRTMGTITFVNDSKATNAESTIPALHSYSNVYWIVGGKPKAEGITPCLPHLANVRGAFAIGEAAAAFAKELKPHVPVTVSKTMDVAVHDATHAARQAVASGDADAVVLLSPACASFDQFDNFEHRGDTFASLCKALKE
ncbi:MAG: UDP-N-acetylmuramoyl-L-alanine--D-glutamate ligase [Alphaproteobacteria bacterium]